MKEGNPDQHELDERRVLVITYYWPPSGGSGVQRWLKFVKYLPHFGVMPYVFTPENPSFDIKDESLLKDVPVEAEVIRFPIWEPYDVFFKVAGLFGKKTRSNPSDFVGKKEGAFNKISNWIRGNLFIPDPRIFWVRPSVRFLNDFIKDNKIDVVITTGPPHSVHLIGLKLKKRNPDVRWLADFRDPWSEWGLLDSLGVGSLSRRLHRKLESRVLKNADIVTTITPFYVKQFERLSGRKVQLLTNGYDEDDFADLAPVKTERFVIRHVGIVNEKCDPRSFMLAVKGAAGKDASFAEDVVIDFVGKVHPAFREWVEKDEFLRTKTTFTPTVPHGTLINLYNTSSLLLLVLEGYRDAEGYMPGKLFEYIATGLPVLGVGPRDGDAAQLLEGAGLGRMISGKESDEIMLVLQKYYRSWDELQYSAQPRKLKYSRLELTKQLVRDIIGW